MKPVELNRSLTAIEDSRLPEGWCGSRLEPGAGAFEDRTSTPPGTICFSADPTSIYSRPSLASSYISLPPQDGVGRHDDQSLPPAGPDPDQPDPRERRSVVRNLGRGTVRLYTASCWRRARFSRAS